MYLDAVGHTDDDARGSVLAREYGDFALVYDRVRRGAEFVYLGVHTLYDDGDALYDHLIGGVGTEFGEFLT